MLVIKKIRKEMLPQYSEIPIAFRVETRLKISPIKKGQEGFKFIKEYVAPFTKWKKEKSTSRPTTWPNKFNVENWGIFLAYDNDIPVGGIAIGLDAPGGLTSPFESKNMAVVWDIRVHPHYRKTGIATLLFNNGKKWAKEKGYHHLKLETSSANYPIFNFCIKQGCELVGFHLYGYKMTPNESDESMLIWYYNLT
jgi:GNAT superfamily N-acetyltransferase